MKIILPFLGPNVFIIWLFKLLWSPECYTISELITEIDHKQDIKSIYQCINRKSDKILALIKSANLRLKQTERTKTQRILRIFVNFLSDFISSWFKKETNFVCSSKRRKLLNSTRKEAVVENFALSWMKYFDGFDDLSNFKIY